MPGDLLRMQSELGESVPACVSLWCPPGITPDPTAAVSAHCGHPELRPLGLIFVPPFSVSHNAAFFHF